MSEIKLLPCPFCGGEFEEINNTSCKQGDNWLWSTECMECGLFIEDKDKENLIKRINTRKSMERIVERLEEEKIEMYKEWLKSSHFEDKGKYLGCKRTIEIVEEEGGIE